MKKYQNKEELEKIYIQEGSILKVAKKMNANEKTISVWMKKFGIKNKGSLGAKKHFFDEKYFFNINTEEKAYWFGFIMADGCIYSNKKSKRLQINLAYKDKEHLLKFQKSIKSNYKIQDKKIKNSKASLLKINSTQMCIDLINNGILERKSLINEYPKNLSDKYFKDFLRGYFDGDGCFSRNYESSLKILGTQKFLKEIQKKIKVKSSLYKNKNIYSLEITNKKDKELFLDYIYSNSRIYLDRKYNRYVHFKSNLIDKT